MFKKLLSFFFSITVFVFTSISALAAPTVSTLDIGDFGRTAIAADANGKAHIVYYHGDDKNLYYSTNKNGRFTRETIPNATDILGIAA